MDWVPLELLFEPFNPKYGAILFRDLFQPNNSHLGPFWVIFRTFLGHIADLEATKGLLPQGNQAVYKCVVHVFLVWLFRAIFGPLLDEKKGCFWPETQHISDLAPMHRVPPVSWGLKYGFGK